VGAAPVAEGGVAVVEGRVEGAYLLLHLSHLALHELPFPMWNLRMHARMNE
jgi:hypothetical protein